jgi:hypothetical protein
LQDAAPPNPNDDRRYDRMLVQVRTGDPPPTPLRPGYVRLDDTKTWQLESLPPDELARIVRTAIKECLDRDAYDAVLVEEREVREEVFPPRRQ